MRRVLGRLRGKMSRLVAGHGGEPEERLLEEGERGEVDHAVAGHKGTHDAFVEKNNSRS